MTFIGVVKRAFPHTETIDDEDFELNQQTTVIGILNYMFKAANERFVAGLGLGYDESNHNDKSWALAVGIKLYKARYWISPLIEYEINEGNKEHYENHSYNLSLSLGMYL